MHHGKKNLNLKFIYQIDKKKKKKKNRSSRRAKHRGLRERPVGTKASDDTGTVNLRQRFVNRGQ
jgi:hypothetical protein